MTELNSSKNLKNKRGQKYIKKRAAATKKISSFFSKIFFSFLLETQSNSKEK